MKIVLSFIVSFVLTMNSYAQEFSQSFKTITVNRKIKEFPDQFDLSSPLSTFITYNYIDITGKGHLLREVSTAINQEYLPDSSVSDSKITEEYRKNVLNRNINEVIIYNDSVACVISEIRESYYSIRCFTLENGKWVNFCEDGRNNLTESRKYFVKNANRYLHALTTFRAITIMPSDTISYINYLKNQSSDPKEFVIDKLKNYTLVMYGEFHRRKSSWDFLQKVVNDERFARNTGVVFMEMASHKQKDIDSFLNKNTIDRELLLNVFREYIDIGWNDKGMFDFVVCIWQLNKKLPADKKIKIIAADTPRPFSTFFSKEDIINNDARFDRDEFMANTTLNYLELKKDKRNALFIVGTAHVGKTLASAGSILTRKLPDNSYTIFTHCPASDNHNVNGRIRYGMFDYAFYKSGDHPVAFELKNSPFGKEPFDALYPGGFGTYHDNYDGYIFFGSLDKEPNFEWLPDLYSDEFIKEVDRRLHLEGTSLKEEWGLKELSKTAVMEKLLANPSKTRWENRSVSWITNR